MVKQTQVVIPTNPWCMIPTTKSGARIVQPPTAGPSPTAQQWPPVAIAPLVGQSCYR